MRKRFPEATYKEIEEAYEKIKGQFLDAKGRSLGWTPRSICIRWRRGQGYDLDQISINAYVISEP